jgi:hypothetical protein
MGGDHLPKPLSFHPHICSSVSAINILIFSLNSDDEAIARHRRIAVHNDLDVFLVVRCYNLFFPCRSILPLGHTPARFFHDRRFVANAAGDTREHQVIRVLLTGPGSPLKVRKDFGKSQEKMFYEFGPFRLNVAECLSSGKERWYR